MMTYDIAAVTETGKVRQTNQDAYLVRTGAINGQPAALLAVADGMGGLSHGEIASGLAVGFMEQWWQAHSGAKGLAWNTISETLDAAIYEAHRQVYFYGEKLQKKTGTTLSLLFLSGRAYLLKQIGDSRIYLSQNGKTLQITSDQTWRNEKIAEGALTPEEAANHYLSHALTNAIGASTELEIAAAAGEVQGSVAFLLCSDGFYNGLPGLAETAPWGGKNAAQKDLSGMLEKVLAGRASDNITAVLCKIPRFL